jgi:hypothetical protein
MREAGHAVVETDPSFRSFTERFSNTNQRTKMKMREVTLSVLGFGVVCDKRFSMLKWYPPC